MKLSFWPWEVHFLHFLKCRTNLYAGSAPFQDGNYIAAVQNGKNISQKTSVEQLEKSQMNSSLIMRAAWFPLQKVIQDILNNSY